MYHVVHALNVRFLLLHQKRSCQNHGFQYLLFRAVLFDFRAILRSDEVGVLAQDVQTLPVVDEQQIFEQIRQQGAFLFFIENREKGGIAANQLHEPFPALV